MAHIMLNVLNQKTTNKMDYTDLLCWLHQNSEDDLLLMTAKEYRRFIESEIEDDEMDMQVTNTEQIYSQGIAGADIYGNEDTFVSGRITDNENDIFLKLNVSGIVEDYVLLYA